MRRFAWLAVFAAVPVHAAEFAPASRIDAVTVFPDGARITRRMETALPPGAHATFVRGLPPNVDPASLRIAGAGGSALAIGSADRSARLRTRRKSQPAQLSSLGNGLGSPTFD